MERSRKRMPMSQRSKGACTIAALAVGFGCAVFGVGGADGGTRAYARHLREARLEARLAGAELSHRSPEQLLLAIRPKAHAAATPAAPAVTQAPIATSAHDPRGDDDLYRAGGHDATTTGTSHYDAPAPRQAPARRRRPPPPARRPPAPPPPARRPPAPQPPARRPPAPPRPARRPPAPPRPARRRPEPRRPARHHRNHHHRNHHDRHHHDRHRPRHGTTTTGHDHRHGQREHRPKRPRARHHFDRHDHDRVPRPLRNQHR